MNHCFFRFPYSLTAAWLFVLSALFLAAAPADAQRTFVSLTSFTSNGIYPEAALIQGSDGNFYGTAQEGGASNDGTIFKVSPSGALTTLASFTGPNGSDPSSSLVQGSDGGFYGTTYAGGASNDGTVFKVTPAGTLTTLASFAGTNGQNPSGTLVLESDGNIYGTTQGGGASNDGTVFKVSSSGALTSIVSFTGVGGADPGREPIGGLIQGTDGNFYGTAAGGGSSHAGTVFKVSSSGALTTLVNFAGANGQSPFAGLVQGTDGDFYGATLGGGSNGSGTVFKMSSSGALTTLYSFSATDSNDENSDGALVYGALVQGSDGSFYGTTNAGGSSGNGTVFKISSSGALATLYSFSATVYNGTTYLNSDGASPSAGLALGRDGNFYGTTTAGGPAGNGTVFELASSGELTTLANFTYPDGTSPSAGLALGSDGDFYGTTMAGGSCGEGTVFKVSSSGALTTLANFTGDNGASPTAGLVLGSDGNFYGTTNAGGSTGNGTVFKVSSSGTLTTLVNFVGANGSNPDGALLLGSDGNFYGTVTQGGAFGNGAVFRVTPSGTLTTLVNFTGNSGADPGAIPVGALVEGSDGSYYGTASLGGASGDGTVFTVTSAGALTTLVDFAGTDGSRPEDGFVQGSDGSFYGTTYQSGAFGNGTVFKVTPTGTLTTLYDFSGTTGSFPAAGLVLGSDGDFYGATYYGGASGDGTVFKVTPAGTLTTLVNFTGADGTDPGASPNSLLLGNDGNLYGTTSGGGSGELGTIFGLFGPPATYGASESTTENTPVSFTVAFDDPSGKGVTSIAFPTEPSHGTLTVGAITEMGGTGTVALTYTPNGNYVGADSFAYTVTGYTGTSTPQAVTLSVKPAGPPTITAYAPGSGYVGTSVTVTGTNFLGATAFTFNGMGASFSVVSATSIKAVVPAGATTGHLSVTTLGGTNTTYGVFQVLAPSAPDITGYTPGSGPAGTVVTIYGDNFTGAASVSFNGAVASFSVVSATSILATVPAGATTGHITVADPAGSYTTPGIFVVLPPGSPTVTAYAPGSGPAGTAVTLTGTNFTGATSVKFNGTAAMAFTVVSPTSILATVPAGATTGHISVSNPSGTFTTPGNFVAN